MNTLVLQLMQVTIRRGLSVLILSLINTLIAQATSAQTPVVHPKTTQAPTREPVKHNCYGPNPRPERSTGPPLF